MRAPRFVVVCLLFVAAGGCSRPGKPELRFDEHKWLLGTIRQADRVTLYEGLPHPHWEAALLEQETRTKETVDLHGWAFYARPLDLTDADRTALVALLADEASFYERPDFEKPCGGYHPDYAVEWAVGDQVYRCLICYGCGEVKVYGPAGPELYCNISVQEPLKQLLKPYWKNRPASDHWPSRKGEGAHAPTPPVTETTARPK